MSRLPAQEEVPMPPVTSGCFRCAVEPADIDIGSVIVSPTGKAHYGKTDGDTECGIDATGDKWWWPL
jgi:hypothetical protein